MVSFTKFLALAAVALAAPTADANGLINANVDANVANVADVNADVHILPVDGGYPSNGYPGDGYPGNGYPGGGHPGYPGYPGYPGRRGGLLDLDLDLGLLNGYGRGGLLDLNLGLGLLNGLWGGYPRGGYPGGGYPGRY
ncbi:hypothetical protein CONCODRAFT_85988 [Conidiobolus coronatus NRRL 28638]|uniref:Uncharacterized protein n=1 Tax=Conidiobolus coronatus (strain ATCC 28846 / CBS 209.66 / NRRL 28638) TaxID=796925 RepID=A0A137P2Z1_CONC2|nr:hypothetical protein CONCODRAFT_85988 [Conidiobolus coronatus NRRL 28638]|eukprot:KXN69299.1 hypothetical protein CONCODRAFT_85988 [Conidiobolus coronatus NRRL 28638]